MTRHLPENEAHLDEPGEQPGQGGPDSGGQSGDTQALPRPPTRPRRPSKSLPTRGRATRAGILEGIEDAADHPEKPVPNHDGPERREDAAPSRGTA